MDLKKSCRADKTLMESGTWVPVFEDAEIFVASLGNSRQVEFEQGARRRARQAGQNTIPEEIENESIARFVLLDWRNIEEGGKPLKPTYENRKKIISEYPQFRAIVLSAAGDFATFERQAQEAELKN